MFISNTDSLWSSAKKAAVIKYEDDTVLLGLVFDDAENALSFDLVQNISDYCSKAT